MIQSTVLPEIMNELNDLEDLVKWWRDKAEYARSWQNEQHALTFEQCADGLEYALNAIFKRHMTPSSSTA